MLRRGAAHTWARSDLVDKCLAVEVVTKVTVVPGSARGLAGQMSPLTRIFACKVAEVTKVPAGQAWAPDPCTTFLQPGTAG